MLNLIQMVFINALLPFSIKMIKLYVFSTETKNDDKILEVSKLGVDYLAKSTNNTVTKALADVLNSTEMKNPKVE